MSVDVLTVIDDVIAGSWSKELHDELRQAREVVRELIEAADAAAGTDVGIAPRDRKLHKLRAALANCRPQP